MYRRKGASGLSSRNILLTVEFDGSDFYGWQIQKEQRTVQQDLRDTLREMLQEPESHVYVHCIAGQNRSPTVVWLYLIACGVSLGNAKRLIEAKSPDSIPGHKKLVSQQLIDSVVEYGSHNIQPLSRPEIIESA